MAQLKVHQSCTAKGYTQDIYLPTDNLIRIKRLIVNKLNEKDEEEINKIKEDFIETLSAYQIARASDPIKA